MFLNETVPKSDVKPVVSRRISQRIGNHALPVCLHICIEGCRHIPSRIFNCLTFQLEKFHGVPDHIREGGGLLYTDIIIVCKPRTPLSAFRCYQDNAVRSEERRVGKEEK